MMAAAQATNFLCVLLLAIFVSSGYCRDVPKLNLQLNSTEPHPQWLSKSNYHECVLKSGKTIHVWQPLVSYVDGNPGYNPVDFCFNDSQGSSYVPMNAMTKEQAMTESCLDNAFDTFGRNALTDNLLLPKHQLVLPFFLNFVIPKIVRTPFHTFEFKWIRKSVLRYHLYTPKVYRKNGEPPFSLAGDGQNYRFLCAMETTSYAKTSENGKLLKKGHIWIAKDRKNMHSETRSCGVNKTRLQWTSNYEQFANRFPAEEIRRVLLRQVTHKRGNISMKICGTVTTVGLAESKIPEFNIFPRTSEAGNVRHATALRSPSPYRVEYAWLPPLQRGYTDAIFVNCSVQRQKRFSEVVLPPVTYSKWVKATPRNITESSNDYYKIKTFAESANYYMEFVCTFRSRYVDGTYGEEVLNILNGRTGVVHRLGVVPPRRNSSDIFHSIVIAHTTHISNAIRIFPGYLHVLERSHRATFNIYGKKFWVSRLFMDSLPPRLERTYKYEKTVTGAPSVYWRLSTITPPPLNATVPYGRSYNGDFQYKIEIILDYLPYKCPYEAFQNGSRIRYSTADYVANEIVLTKRYQEYKLAIGQSGTLPMACDYGYYHRRVWFDLTADRILTAGSNFHIRNTNDSLLWLDITEMRGEHIGKQLLCASPPEHNFHPQLDLKLAEFDGVGSYPFVFTLLERDPPNPPQTNRFVSHRRLNGTAVYKLIYKPGDTPADTITVSCSNLANHTVNTVHAVPASMQAGVQHNISMTVIHLQRGQSGYVCHAWSSYYKTHSKSVKLQDI